MIKLKPDRINELFVWFFSTCALNKRTKSDAPKITRPKFGPCPFVPFFFFFFFFLKITLSLFRYFFFYYFILLLFLFYFFIALFFFFPFLFIFYKDILQSLLFPPLDCKHERKKERKNGRKQLVSICASDCGTSSSFDARKSEPGERVRSCSQGKNDDNNNDIINVCNALYINVVCLNGLYGN
jgi:predicted membrane protein